MCYNLFKEDKMDDKDTNYDYIFEIVNEKLKNELTPWRYSHTMSVMNLSIKLAKYYDVDETKAKIAALFHDYAKEYSEEKMMEFARKIGVDGKYPFFGLYHGVIASYIAKENYGIQDEEILSAIEHHTLSKLNSSKLDKILFVADTADVSRNEEGLDEIRDLFYVDLNRAFLGCINHKLKYNLDKGKKIEPVVYELIKEIESEINNERN